MTREGEAQARRNRRNRLSALIRYGGMCVCCGETFEPFLSIDHVDGGGTLDRKSKRMPFYKWLARQPKSDSYQVLCHNCNQAKRTAEECPCKNGAAEQRTLEELLADVAQRQAPQDGLRRLSDDDVREIRRLHRLGMSSPQIAIVYDMNDRYIRSILSGDRRGNVAD